MNERWLSAMATRPASETDTELVRRWFTCLTLGPLFPKSLPLELPNRRRMHVTPKKDANKGNISQLTRDKG